MPWHLWLWLPSRLYYTKTVIKCNYSNNFDNFQRSSIFQTHITREHTYDINASMLVVCSFVKWSEVKWRDMLPSMVTHTRNLCSAINPSKVHTHSSEHTTGAVGSHLCCGARGAVGGSVPCSRAPQSWYWGWRERCTFTPPTYNSCRPETRTLNLWVTSPTL